MTTYVLDTSVVLKWFNTDNEEHVDQALAILRDLKDERITIIVPNLLIIELVNVFMKGKQLLPKDIQMLITNFLAMPLVSKEPTEAVLLQIPLIHETHTIAAYDALYVALAREENCQLISDDRKAHGKITDGTVLMLEQYQSA